MTLFHEKKLLRLTKASIIVIIAIVKMNNTGVYLFRIEEIPATSSFLDNNREETHHKTSFQTLTSREDKRNLKHNQVLILLLINIHMFASEAIHAVVTVSINSALASSYSIHYKQQEFRLQLRIL